MRLSGLIVALALAGSGLAGCNMVHSSRPMFSAADAAGGPVFRDGVWASPEPRCQFDPNKPVETWPKCANGSAHFDMKPVESYLTVSGDPAIVQLRSVGDDQAVNYLYAAVTPMRTDAEGRVVAFKAWVVLCGPPNKGPAMSRAGKALTLKHAGTRHPLAGLTMDADGDNCTPADPSAVRAAAVASRAWAEDLKVVAWVRDGDH